MTHAARKHSRDADIERLRTPPHSLEAEQSVLGGLLIDNQAWDKAADLLTEADFYRWEHRLIFAACSQLIMAGKPADVVTVHAHLRNTSPEHDVGGLAYLDALAQAVPSAANLHRYAEIVREKSVLRRLVSAADDIATQALNTGGREVSEILDQAETAILKIGESGARKGQGFQGMDSLMVQLLDTVAQAAENGGTDVTGVRTGFVDLDRQTTGLQPGDLIILAARPSMGKTALAMNFAEQVAVVDARPTLVFSMEMSANQLASRMVGSMGRIDQQRLRTGRLNDDEWGRLGESVERMRTAQLYIDDTPGLTPGELRARARRQARECGGIGLIVIDYLQLMAGSGNEENRATEVGEISRSLKALAKELKCPVVALSQLNRSVETRADKRPMMSDLRESGAIEQDADVIMFIYRDEYYTKEHCKEPGVSEIIISKQRNGPVGTVKLGFQREHTRFVNLAAPYSRSAND